MRKIPPKLSCPSVLCPSRVKPPAQCSCKWDWIPGNLCKPLGTWEIRVNGFKIKKGWTEQKGRDEGRGWSSGWWFLDPKLEITQTCSRCQPAPGPAYSRLLSLRPGRGPVLAQKFEQIRHLGLQTASKQTCRVHNMHVNLLLQTNGVKLGL